MISFVQSYDIAKTDCPEFYFHYNNDLLMDKCKITPRTLLSFLGWFKEFKNLFKLEVEV